MTSRLSFRHTLAVAALLGLGVATASAQDQKEEKPAITLSDAEQAALDAVEAAIKRFDTLLNRVEDVHEKASVKAFLDAQKNRLWDLKKKFDQALCDNLRLDVEIEYQRLIAWMADPLPTRANRRNLDIPAALSSREGRYVPNDLSPEEKAAGWRLLWDGMTFRGWRGYGLKGLPVFGWEIKDGTLHAVPVDPEMKVPFEVLRQAELITEKKYTDFELAWEWKVAKGANSGLKYMVTEERPSAPGLEFQMVDDLSSSQRNPLNATAGLYAIVPPAADAPYRPAGEWNSSRIVVRGTQIEHWHNGKRVVSTDLNSPEVKAGIARSKFKNEPGFGQKIPGHIMLTFHGDEAWVRNIKIRELNGSGT